MPGASRGDAAWRLASQLGYAWRKARATRGAYADMGDNSPLEVIADLHLEALLRMGNYLRPKRAMRLDGDGARSDLAKAADLFAKLASRPSSAAHEPEGECREHLREREETNWTAGQESNESKTEVNDQEEKASDEDTPAAEVGHHGDVESDDDAAKKVSAQEAYDALVKVWEQATETEDEKTHGHAAGERDGNCYAAAPRAKPTGKYGTTKAPNDSEGIEAESGCGETVASTSLARVRAESLPNTNIMLKSRKLLRRR